MVSLWMTSFMCHSPVSYHPQTLAGHKHQMLLLLMYLKYKWNLQRHRRIKDYKHQLKTWMECAEWTRKYVFIADLEVNCKKVYKLFSKNMITHISWWKNRQKMTFLPRESLKVRTATIPVRKINNGMLQIKIMLIKSQQVRNCSVQIRTNRISTVTVICQIRSQLPTVACMV